MKININKGDKVRMVKANKWIPMDVGEEFSVVEVDYGEIVFVFYDGDVEYTYSISENVFNEYFEKVEDEVFYEINDEDFDYIAEILSESKFNVASVFGKCTIVACRLPNGFVIVESSSCVDPDDYDEEIGIENCMNRIKNKVIELEAYIRQDIESDCQYDDDCCGFKEVRHCDDCSLYGHRCNGCI